MDVRYKTGIKMEGVFFFLKKKIRFNRSFILKFLVARVIKEIKETYLGGIFYIWILLV